MSEEANAIIVLFAIVSFVVHFALIGVAKVWRWWHSRSEAEHRAQVRAKWDELRAAAPADVAGFGLVGLGPNRPRPKARPVSSMTPSRSRATAPSGPLGSSRQCEAC